MFYELYLNVSCVAFTRVTGVGKWNMQSFKLLISNLVEVKLLNVKRENSTSDDVISGKGILLISSLFPNFDGSWFLVLFFFSEYLTFPKHSVVFSDVLFGSSARQLS